VGFSHSTIESIESDLNILPYFVADGHFVPLIKVYQTGLTRMAERNSQSLPSQQSVDSSSHSPKDASRIGKLEICPKTPETKEFLYRQAYWFHRDQCFRAVPLYFTPCRCSCEEPKSRFHGLIFFLLI
jgi:hypothetical protein